MRVKRIAVMLMVVLWGTGLAMGQTDWVQHPDNPIVGPGEPGAWDEGGRSATTVLFDGLIYHMWFSGADESLDRTDIGHATSSDGVEWTMDPANPVLTRGDSGAWDDNLLYGAAVTYDGAQFHMWYGGGDGSVQRTGYATSPDGTAWTKYAGNPVIDVGPQGSWDDWIVRAGTVLIQEGMHRMWFMGTSAAGVARIGFAESTDGIEWTKRPEPVLEPGAYPGAWDSPAMGNPFVVFDGSDFHMWFVAGVDRTPPNGRVSIGYAFSSDGITWTKHRDNPVVSTADNYAFLAPVVYDGSTWRMWYSHSDGSADWISHATSDCCPVVADLNHTQFIPAAAVASGAEGAFFQTDVDLSNAGGQPVEYQLMWLPRGEDNSEPMTSENFSLGAGMSVRYANVLSEVFGLEPNSLGALSLVSTSADLLAMSRTYNTPSGEPTGTYGQAIAAIAAEDMIYTGERRRILFATENADLRTNVGCQNGTGSITGIRLELFDMEGTPLATEMMVLQAFGNDQVNRIFGEFAPVTGYVEVWTPVSNRAFHCYGSVLDNTTSDPTTIPPL